MEHGNGSNEKGSVVSVTFAISIRVLVMSTII